MNLQAAVVYRSSGDWIQGESLAWICSKIAAAIKISLTHTFILIHKRTLWAGLLLDWPQSRPSGFCCLWIEPGWFPSVTRNFPKVTTTFGGRFIVGLGGYMVSWGIKK